MRTAVDLVTQYLQRAAEARRMAEKVSDPTAKADLLKIAAMCERWAKRHEQNALLTSNIPAPTSPKRSDDQ